MMAEEFLRVTQCNDLDAAMDAALSSLQPSRRCAQSVSRLPGCTPWICHLSAPPELLYLE